jgi:outer membrane protein assembly factor BamD (BamD/ComL family)
MIPEGLTVGEIFQRAQDAADKGDYSLATAYYTDFQQKYPEDTQHGVWASYEIAFIAHKTGRNDTALSLLDALLARYAKEGDALPPAPRTLAENLKARLEADSPKKS